MPDLHHSRLFTPWRDPQTGLTVYLLTQKVAPLQQSFYFVNDGMSRDGRYLWFYCAFPPSKLKTLGVVDFASQEVRHFPETQFSVESPYVDALSGAVYWCSESSIWRRGPQAGDAAECVNSLPEELIGHRTVSRLATHLSLSPDGKHFFVDASIGLHYLFGTLPLDGGDFELWERFDRHFDHAQFCPTDPDLVLFSMENHPDQLTGLFHPVTDRMWLIRRGERARPVFPGKTVVTHEWWDSGGEHVWCVDCPIGLRKVAIADSSVEKVWEQEGSWHGHNHTSGRYVVVDRAPWPYRGCASTVEFLNRDTGRSLRVIDNPEMGGITGARYHIDPHPRFCCGDQYLVFTTTVRGEVDLAIIPTASLIERTI